MTEKLNREELLSALGSIYCPTIGDWEISLHHTLTEPTCPGATVKPENEYGSTFSGFVCIADTIDAAIDGALQQAYDVLILRKGFEPGVPWTNRGDDAELARILKALDEYKAHRETEEFKTENKAVHLRVFGHTEYMEKDDK